MISVIIETWNVDGEPAALARLLAQLAPQVTALAAEVIVTHSGIDERTRERLACSTGTALGQHRGAGPSRPRSSRDAVTWVELPRDAGYYEHKNRGFDASRGDIVAFIDGDCDPAPGWLAAVTAPIAAGAQVVAGATSYAGAMAPLANELDFPYFDGADARRRFAATSEHQARTVRNFFANNVAFAREAFATRLYPTLPMFHGQCQVLALRFVEAGIPIVFAPEARVTHAWPEGVAEWLEVRLLRGADTTRLLPHVLATYAPAASSAARRLGPLPALGVLALRAATGTWSALRRGPVLRGLALVAAVTVADALGAAAAPAVYRWIA